MTHDDSAHVFYLIDQTGNRRVPHKVKGKDGRFGYAIHAIGKGNDRSAAIYTEDEQLLVQQVVLHGKLIRCRATSGPQKGQTNSVGLARRTIRGYWLHPTKAGWAVDATVRPTNEGACA